jgi:hypothetical protein
MKILYPWATLRKNEAFFVPGLNVEKIREHGLMSALPFRYPVKAAIGIKDGKLGVLFSRVR